MTVFKTFFKVLNKLKGVIIMYTAMLLFFGGFTITTSEENNIGFMEEKPSIMIVNKDENTGVTKNLIDYITSNSEIVDIENNEDKIDDALFYRDVSYVIYIPKGYREEFLEGLNPEIKIKQNGNYEASYAGMLLEKYLSVADIYRAQINDEKGLINKINNDLNYNVTVNVSDKVDKSSFRRVTFYYNFANYSILAGLIFIVCLSLLSFKKDAVNKRTIISSIDYKKYNRQLFLSCMIYAVVLWILYVLISFILASDAMMSLNGLCYIFNSFIFTVCALALAFLISNLVTNRNAINGVVNVLALGSSFLCGSFVPVEFLPDSVLFVAHIFPSYYYIQNNEMLETIVIKNISDISQMLGNIVIMVLFTLIFVIITNMISKKKRKIG